MGRLHFCFAGSFRLACPEFADKRPARQVAVEVDYIDTPETTTAFGLVGLV